MFTRSHDCFIAATIPSPKHSSKCSEGFFFGESVCGFHRRTMTNELICILPPIYQIVSEFPSLKLQPTNTLMQKPGVGGNLGV